MVAELMGQASDYKALGKTAEAREIYERIVRRTEFSNKDAITELATLYNIKQRGELYKAAALHALSRFDGLRFAEYCKVLGEELSFAVNIRGDNDPSIEVSLEDETITVKLEDIEEKNYNILLPEEEVVTTVATMPEQASDVEEKVSDSLERKPKRNKHLPQIAEIADVLQSGGIEQALYMLDVLEAKEGEVRDLWYLKALCYVSNNEMITAKEAIEKELKLYPDNEKAKRLAEDISHVVGK